jgi:hypothetical protein
LLAFLEGQLEIYKNLQALKVPIFYRFLFFHIRMILLVIILIEIYILLATFRDIELQEPNILKHILSLPSLNMSVPNHCKVLQIPYPGIDLYLLHQLITFLLNFCLYILLLASASSIEINAF